MKATVRVSVTWSHAARSTFSRVVDFVMSPTADHAIQISQHHTLRVQKVIHPLDGGLPVIMCVPITVVDHRDDDQLPRVLCDAEFTMDTAKA